MNELNSKTMNTTAATIENAQPAAWPVTYETMTIGEYLDRVETGEIANPEFQSGQRWTEKQRAACGMPDCWTACPPDDFCPHSNHGRRAADA